MSAAPLKDRAAAGLDAAMPTLQQLSHRLYHHPELGFEETRASAWLADELRALPGARVQHGLGALPTAVRADIGSGELVVTVCAEYDALPVIGHGCGHNIICAAALGAATALAPLVDELGITLRVLGTPAEENGGGKVLMLRQGDFDGTHAAMMIHPGPHDETFMNAYACTAVTARFIGRAAHASAQPFDGVNALDALTIALSAIGLARQQLRPGQQIHGYVRQGGTAPNVIPDLAEAQWMTRAHDMASLQEVTAVLRRCVEAGALAAGCELDVREEDVPYANFVLHPVLVDAWSANSTALGRTPSSEVLRGGSTDMANVSHYYPTMHPMVRVGTDGPPMHTAAFADRAAGPDADDAIRHGALGMAWTVIDVATDPRRRHELLTWQRTPQCQTAQ